MALVDRVTCRAGFAVQTVSYVRYVYNSCYSCSQELVIECSSMKESSLVLRQPILQPAEKENCWNFNQSLNHSFQKLAETATGSWSVGADKPMKDFWAVQEVLGSLQAMFLERRNGWCPVGP